MNRQERLTPGQLSDICSLRYIHSYSQLIPHIRDGNKRETASLSLSSIPFRVKRNYTHKRVLYNKFLFCIFFWRVPLFKKMEGEGEIRTANWTESNT